VNIISLIFILIILPIGVYSCIISHFYPRQIFASLTENGTCIDGLHGVPAQILKNNGINGSFNKLTTDNRELAEIICQNLLNGNATIDMSPSNCSNDFVNQSSR